MINAKKVISMVEEAVGMRASADDVQVGSILCAVDYYSETLNRDFYQVVKKTAKSVTIQPIKASYRMMGGYDASKPIVDDFDGKPRTVRLKPDGSVSIDRYRTATLWNGKAA